jgi:hypothetical protein
MLCACVSEEGGDGEDAVSEAPSLLSYTLRYISLAELGTLCRVGLRERCTYELLRFFLFSLLPLFLFSFGGRKEKKQ